eukprot:578229-Alexandrium_andersonii.AAC.1
MPRFWDAPSTCNVYDTIDSIKVRAQCCGPGLTVRSPRRSLRWSRELLLYVDPDPKDLHTESWWKAAQRPENTYSNTMLPYSTGPPPYSGKRWRPDLQRRAEYGEFPTE